MKNYDRVWATVDLDAVKYNLVQMKNNIREDSKIMAVVKTDGYGHGAVPIAHEIEICLSFTVLPLLPWKRP